MDKLFVQKFISISQKKKKRKKENTLFKSLLIISIIKSGHRFVLIATIFWLW